MSSLYKVIQTTSSTDKVHPLAPGELGFSYKSKSLFIGPESGDTSNVQLLLSLDNSTAAFNDPLSIIIQDVVGDLSDKVPSSRAVAEQLLKKASLIGGNEFLGSNLVPDVDIQNTPYTLGKLIVNINSIKGYIDHRMQNSPTSARYMFNTLSDRWEIIHNKNTSHCTTSIYNSIGHKMVAPVVVTSNNIIVYLSTPMIGYVDVVFL